MATLVDEEVHWALEVTSAVLLSEKVPIATNCWVASGLMVAVAGVTLMPDRVAAEVVAKAAADLPPKLAVI